MEAISESECDVLALGPGGGSVCMYGIFCSSPVSVPDNGTSKSHAAI